MFCVDFSNIFIIVFVAGTIATFLVNQLLEYLDFRARCKNGGKVPEVLKNIEGAAELFNEEKLKKIVEYENAKYFLWLPKSFCGILLTLALVLFGFYPWIFGIVTKITGMPHSFLSVFACYLLFSILAEIPEEILSLPFALYREFSIEKRFGFSKMTVKLWLQDLLKDSVIGLIMNTLLTLCVSFAFCHFAKNWWLVVSFVLLAFVLLIQIIYPKFIAPLFNKFEPLPEGELKDKIAGLLEKIGFKNGGLFIMDASKRSGHSNAYFSGFGKNKRIVLYDTLVNQMTTDELVAVLGHELGHFKLKHITRRLVLTIPLIFAVMFVLFQFTHLPGIYSSFGFSIEANQIEWVQFLGLTLVSMVWSAVAEILTPFSNISSRRHEYQADAFAAKTLGSGAPLISALVKLNSENLSELFPPAIYVWWNYSHPTLIQRVQALNAINAAQTEKSTT
ncbi:MAG: M48 family metallopeptidase [Treponemataceae bacterium]|nr:M48 family metallopeptidase [Treponemataceae bacterium]